MFQQLTCQVCLWSICYQRSKGLFRGGRLPRTLKQLAKHGLLATIVSTGTPLIASMVFIAVLRRLRLEGPIRRWNFDAWYMPFLWWPGFVYGFLTSRRVNQLAACFVWVLGLLFLGWGILNGTSNLQAGTSWLTHTRITLFPHKQAECGDGSECLGVLFYTMPFLNTITYSIGAALGLLSSSGEGDSREPLSDSTSLGLN
jgi:hypothetical protein